MRMSDSKGEPTPPESSDRKGSKEQAVVPESEQQRALAALLAKKVDELASLPEDEKRKEITATISRTQTFSGPLPTPEAFARYNNTVRHRTRRGALTEGDASRRGAARVERRTLPSQCHSADGRCGIGCNESNVGHIRKVTSFH